jgi:hypothetical protein
MCAIIIIIIIFYSSTIKRMTMTPSSSFSYRHFAGVKKKMSPTRHPLMLFCKREKMTTNNYTTHRCCGVVL